MVGQKPFRRCPGWTRVPPINVVILHRHEERETEIEDGPGWGGYSRPAMLPYRRCCCLDIALQMAHPATCTIALHALDLLSTRPSIEQIRKINPRIHSMCDRQIETRINFHQVGFSHSVAPKLHLSVAFQADFTHQTFCLLAGVRWKGNSLTQYIGATQQGICALPPEGETCIDLAMRREETQGLTSAREELLEESCPPKACQLLNCTSCLIGGRHQFTLQEHGVLFIP